MKNRVQLAVFPDMDSANKWLAERKIKLVGMTTMERPGGHYWFENIKGEGPYILIAYEE